MPSRTGFAGVPCNLERTPANDFPVQDGVSPVLRVLRVLRVYFSSLNGLVRDFTN